MLLAVAMAGAEVFPLHAVTTLRTVCVIGLAQCALLYGSGPQAVITTLRLVVALAALMWIVERLRRRQRARRGNHAPLRSGTKGIPARPVPAPAAQGSSSQPA
ncbi:hypothetical protein E1091_04905 [Micromonospora fluostatini]|uniref:DUF1622 domain-containing protein n=1 Tax=Micromonospora fluostatini TaxID=1629071 RepID=A0ABY2DKG7_9ACTN|nr:hypothetical protein E1091_04905 [Micromonospora fluostatini]